MQRLSLLGLLLACAASLVGSAVILENGLPILWAHTATDLRDLTVDNGDVLTPDPWHYLQRMSLMRLLMAYTNPYMGSMGLNTADSPLWGLTLELSWMMTSGRLADPTSASTCGHQTGDTMCISPNSMWACVNYFVSALPFLSAAEQGFFGQGLKVQMKVPAGAEDYCSTHADCLERAKEATLKWDLFFQGLKSPNDSPVSDAVWKDNILGLYWQAQMTTIYSTTVCESRKNHYASTERIFHKGWERDATEAITDLTDEEKHTLSIFSWMLGVDSVVGGALVSIWEKSMCTMEMRERGREMVDQLMLNPEYATSSFVTFVTVMAVNC